MKIGIIGGGVWGSAIAKLLSNNKVCIIARDSKIVTSINEHRFNPRLKYAVFNENVSATADLNEANNMDYLFITLPSQKIRDVLSKIDLSNLLCVTSRACSLRSDPTISPILLATTERTSLPH